MDQLIWALSLYGFLVAAGTTIALTICAIADRLGLL